MPFALVSHAEVPPPGKIDLAFLRATGAPLAERYGSQTWYRADADGMVLLPRPWRSGRAWCTHESQRGSVDLWSGAAGFGGVRELRLEPDATLEVRVTRGAAPAAGAWVDLGARDEDGDVDRVERRRTDADGVACFAREREVPDAPWEERRELFASLAGVHRDAPEAAYDPCGPPQKVGLELPPSTRLEVEVREADGTLAREPVLVRVDHAGPDAFENEGRVASHVAVSGRASFEQMGPGLAVSVLAQRSLGSRLGSRSEPSFVRTAAAPGETVAVVVALPPPDGEITARLLGGEGPLANREVDVRARLNPKTEFYRGATDSDGRLRLEMLAFQAHPGVELELRVHDARREPAARVRLPEPGPDGVMSLGDVRLRLDPIVVAGRVIDGDGLPVAWARVVVRAERGTQRQGLVESVRSDAEGRFELRAPDEVDVVTVEASHSWFLSSEPSSFAAGTADAAVAMGAAVGRVRGSVRVDVEWLADELSMFARAEGASRWQSSSLDSRGRFDVGHLRPGRYEIGIGIGIGADPTGCARIEDVEVRSGRYTDDPRLREIDARGRPHAFQLRLVDDWGESIEYGDLYARAVGDEGWPLHWGFHDGRSHVVVLAPAIDVRATAEAHEPALLTGVSGDCELVLRRHLAMRIRWEGEPPTEEELGGFFVRLEISRPGAAEIEEVDVDIGGDKPVLVPPDATVDLVWWHEAIEAHGRRTRVVSRQPLALVWTGEVQEVVVVLPLIGAGS